MMVEQTTKLDSIENFFSKNGEFEIYKTFHSFPALTSHAFNGDSLILDNVYGNSLNPVHKVELYVSPVTGEKSYGELGNLSSNLIDLYFGSEAGEFSISSLGFVNVCENVGEMVYSGGNSKIILEDKRIIDGSDSFEYSNLGMVVNKQDPLLLNSSKLLDKIGFDNSKSSRNFSFTPLSEENKFLTRNIFVRIFPSKEYVKNLLEGKLPSNAYYSLSA